MDNSNKKKSDIIITTKNINQIRKKIDSIDRKIIMLLSKRFKLVKKIGHFKNLADLPLDNEQRENEILETIGNIIDNPNVEDKIKTIYKIIFKLSKEIEKEVK
ncbi:MAG: hypothetical protein DRP84_00590 [Spirochaetes bacterium]|nr:MAG: hypothetical protein DRP84_00590 [Spirochaetota bacterium]